MFPGKLGRAHCEEPPGKLQLIRLCMRVSPPGRNLRLLFDFRNHDPEMKEIDPVWAGSDANLHSTIVRYDMATRLLLECQNEHDAGQVMLQPPIKNADTIFGCFMSVKSGDITFL